MLLPTVRRLAMHEGLAGWTGRLGTLTNVPAINTISIYAPDTVLQHEPQLFSDVCNIDPWHVLVHKVLYLGTYHR